MSLNIIYDIMMTYRGSSSTWNTELELFYSGDHVSLLETTMNHLVCLRCHLREDVHNGWGWDRQHWCRQGLGYDYRVSWDPNYYGVHAYAVYSFTSLPASCSLWLVSVTWPLKRTEISDLSYSLNPFLNILNHIIFNAYESKNLMFM